MTKFYYYILALFIKILMTMQIKKMLSLNNCLSGITKLV